MSGQGFEFTPFGMVPIVEDIGASPGVVNHNVASPGAVTPRVPGAPVAAAPAEVAPAAPVIVAPAAPAAPLKPADVVRAARQRVKEINVELKRLNALKKERDELERLLKAAKQKPTASVRPIRNAG